MKCGLVQILALAVLLGHTVSMLGWTVAMNIFGFLPIGLRDTLNPTEVVEDEHILDGIKLIKFTKSGKVRLMNTLDAKVDNMIQDFVAINFAQFKLKDYEKMYDMIDKLFDLENLIEKSKHEDSLIMLHDLNREILSLVKKLELEKENLNLLIDNKKIIRRKIITTLAKIKYMDPHHNVDIKLINNLHKITNVDFKNRGKHLSLGEIVKKLKQATNELDVDITDKYALVHKIYDLLHDISLENRQITKQDIRDTQSMRNVIGISIAVCAIVTLCIVLLIAVRNKHRVNTEVRLFERV